MRGNVWGQSAPFLAAGDLVVVVAPSSGVDLDRVARGVEIVREWGLKVEIHPNVSAKTGYLAGSDEARAGALLEVLSDARVRCVWAARGGYGAVRLLNRMRKRKPERPSPVAVVGFSDVSLLTARLYLDYGFPTLHAANMTTLPLLDTDSLARTRAALMSPFEPIQYSGLKVVHRGTEVGWLLPMNWATLNSVLGTPFAPPLEGAVLLLEDVNEVPYRLDRMLIQLAYSHGFEKLSGLVFGDLDGAESDPTLLATIRQVADTFSLPCCMGMPFGHGAHNVPLRVGASVILSAEEGVLAIS